MNRQQILEAQINEHEDRDTWVNTPATYQEDSAFLNKMKKINFRDMTDSELKRVWRIALTGMDTRKNIDDQIRTLNRERNLMAAEGNLTSGIKLGFMYDRIRDMLKGLR